VTILHVKTWVKVKVTLVQAMRLCTGCKAHRGSRGIAVLFHDHGTRRGWGVSITPRPLFTPRKTRYPLYRRPGGPQGRSGHVREISPPPRFDPRTVQPVAQSLYRLSCPPHEDMVTFMIISRWVLLGMRNVSDRSCRENQDTRFILNNVFPKIALFMRYVEKYCWTGQATYENTVHTFCILYT
jgi:hypothetical protein